MLISDGKRQPCPISVNQASGSSYHPLATGVPKKINALDHVTHVRKKFPAMVMNIHSPLGNHKGMSFLNVAGATSEWLCHNANASFTQKPPQLNLNLFIFVNFRNKTEVLVKYGFMIYLPVLLLFLSFPLALPPLCLLLYLVSHSRRVPPL